jgi:hypothetical protein
MERREPARAWALFAFLRFLRTIFARGVRVGARLRRRGTLLPLLPLLPRFAQPPYDRALVWLGRQRAGVAAAPGGTGDPFPLLAAAAGPPDLL